MFKGTWLILIPLALAAQTSPPATVNKFVGSEVCKTCHADVWLNFYKNPHFKSKTAPHSAVTWGKYAEICSSGTSGV